jgi:DNA repair exonuclease SbcCD nuclease subunit
MKFISTADWHIRGKRPRMRKDDFLEAQFDKVRQIVNLSNEKGAAILNGGDITDRFDTSFKVVNTLIQELKKLDRPMIIVRGNHCTPYHQKDIRNSPLGILVAAGVVECLGETEETQVILMHDGDEAVAVAGMGWQDAPPLVSTGYYNILLAHFSVYEDKPPFYMPEALSVLDFEDRYPGFDFYLAGDIHDTCKKSKTIVPGSMMRNTSAQQSHKPCVFVLDTETKETEQVFLTVEDNVFDLEEIEKIKNEDQVHQEVEARLLTMTQRMNTAEDVVDFQANLTQVSESSSEAVKSIIREVA